MDGLARAAFRQLAIMKTTALRLYGKMDLRLETFDLPQPGDDDILAAVICDSICMSSYKAALQGIEHKRVPADIETRPIIIGHEFAGRFLQVGSRWRDRYSNGQKFALQPALDNPASLHRPGYSFATVGGASTHILIPDTMVETGCLVPYDGEAFFAAALSEPMSCLIRACKAQYHVNADTFAHVMGVRAGGRAALLAACGPMGLGLIDFLLNGPQRPSLLAVTDIDAARLQRAASLFEPAQARVRKIDLRYLNTAAGNPYGSLMELTAGDGFDDVFVLAPVPELVELADALLAKDGCINFFAGPSTPDLNARINIYNLHYAGTHMVGTSGGNIEDMAEALRLTAEGAINPSVMITHIGGLTAAREATLNLPNLPGGKKLIYTQIDMPLVAIDDFAQLGKEAPLFAALDRICRRHRGLWNAEAELFLLRHAPRVVSIF